MNYFMSLDPLALFRSMPGAFAQGMVWGLMALGVYITYRLLDFAEVFSFNEEFVRGMHGMYVKADKYFNDEIKNYDMLVLPGGRPGGQNLLENQDVISLVQYFNEHHQYIAAMCSGTVVLEKANVIKGKKVTGYTGYQDKLVSGDFVNEVAVFDQNIVTSQGPATPYPFAFKILEVFGKDVTEMKEGLMYNFAGGK
jgi:4-methyl-5(b-hydroxyethyl)-thiazole monophosphate biosynthesis